MKRVITIIGLLAAFALLGGHATGARADATGNETCGGSVSNNSWIYTGNQSGNWNLNTTYHCGDQKTFTYEVQHTTDGGNHWADFGGDLGHRSGFGCNNGCNAQLIVPATTCIDTGSYRVHYWWSGGNVATASRGAGMVC